MRDKARYGGNYLNLKENLKPGFTPFYVFVSGHIESGQIVEKDGLCCKYDFVAGTDWSIVEVLFALDSALGQPQRSVAAQLQKSADEQARGVELPVRTGLQIHQRERLAPNSAHYDPQGLLRQGLNMRLRHGARSHPARDPHALREPVRTDFKLSAFRGVRLDPGQKC